MQVHVFSQKKKRFQLSRKRLFIPITLLEIFTILELFSYAL